jgi:hypothetical protein
MAKRPAVGINPNIPIPVQRDLRKVAQFAFDANDKADMAAQELLNKIGNNNTDLLAVSKFVRAQLQAGGQFPISISSLPGRSSQNQYAYIPVVNALPGPGSPLSVPGQAVWYNGAIYVYVNGVWQTQSHSLEPIDPRYWGAAANGSTDDSVAISDAITSGGLYLRAGLVFAYTWGGISSAIGGITNNFTITGGGTLKLLSGSTAALTFSGSTRVRLLGFTVDGNSQTGSNPVIHLNGVSDVWLNSVFVQGASTGLTSTNTTYDARGCHGIPDNIGFI